MAARSASRPFYSADAAGVGRHMQLQEKTMKKAIFTFMMVVCILLSANYRGAHDLHGRTVVINYNAN